MTYSTKQISSCINIDSEYDILKISTPKNPNSNNRFLKNLNINIEHYGVVSLKEKVSRIEEPETVTGIMNFPYIGWEELEEILQDIPFGWKLFIINPILMRYAKRSIGLFLTPEYGEDIFIEECNSFIQKHTGYPLFLEYSNNENIPQILFDKPELSIDGYVEEMKKYSANRGLSKLLDFWAENDCIRVSSFEYSFKDYMDNLPYLVWEDINFKEIKSFTPFKLVHEETGEILGPFHKFALDKTFKLADTNNGVLKLTDRQINDLIDGKYDFKLIK